MMARCPECGERIGGAHHQMVNTNRRLGKVKQNVLNGKDVSFEKIGTVYKDLVGENTIHVDSFDADEYERRRGRSKGQTAAMKRAKRQRRERQNEQNEREEDDTPTEGNDYFNNLFSSSE
eukprot:TRINITY_DN1953_c0_g1_i2.p2 TRINITY_DN1953_c0_g1~~TRINITY_DN1953_c0_g1_i2.p2  ORF type:complete len:120 (+),score=32.94 TRINITY_DN1953_c0_g1_i2:404-763(+)